jgi:hypothetical protein
MLLQAMLGLQQDAPRGKLYVAVMFPADTPCFDISRRRPARSTQPGRTTELQRDEDRAKIGSDRGRFFEKMIE